MIAEKAVAIRLGCRNYCTFYAKAQSTDGEKGMVFHNMQTVEQQNICQNIKSLFLSQAYQDAFEDYNRSINNPNYITWDYIVLTASNEAQAEAFRLQINARCEKGLLPSSTKYAVLPDPDGRRVGSGGATFNVIKYLAEQLGMKENMFEGKRILVIHSGGDSKRVPQYSAIGKLFSPVPRRLPDGRGSTLFDEFIIGMSGVPSRIKDGMLVLSGDVLLLFNSLQIDGQLDGAAAISIKETVGIGKNHGVFLSDGNGYVKNFLHKQSEESLREIGAASNYDMVDLDTGAILLSMNIVESLYGLVSTNYKVDISKFESFVNESARISFYGDFLYPLAEASTLEQYYQEKPEGEFTPELRKCREALWKVLNQYKLKLICLSPAKFIHFGTTRELLHLMTEGLEHYHFLEWKPIVQSAAEDKPKFAAYQSYVGHKAKIAERVYLEESYVLKDSEVAEGTILSHVKVTGQKIPANVVIHGLPIVGDKYVARIYGVMDNPKGNLAEKTTFLTSDLRSFISKWKLSEADFWYRGQSFDLWNARLFPVCDTEEEALNWALKLYQLVDMKEAGAQTQVIQNWGQQINIVKVLENDIDTAHADAKELINQYLSMPRISLCDSFNRADLPKVIARSEDLSDRILSKLFIDELATGDYCEKAFFVLGKKGMTKEIYNILLQDALGYDFSLRIRIYYAVSRYMKLHNLKFEDKGYSYPEQLCFEDIQKVVFEQAIQKLPSSDTYQIAQEEVNVQLPVRVNWGGGWTDTPPYCMEQGGVVLNAAISLNGILPVQITLRKLEEYKVTFESQDIGVKGDVFSLSEIQNCHDPYDPFSLHKAALIACGIVPMNSEKGDSLEQILQKLGGGIYLSTQVVGIPKGSGLGTSSILAAGCVKGIFEFLGQEKTNDEIYEIVLCMEQIMSTGGGWQDQVGGLTPGIKMITTRPGMDQKIEVKPVIVPEETMAELQERFALIYTGQRRLARNLLREIVGNYIGALPSSVEALREMKPTAALMQYYLEHGDVDEFAKLLDKHWELSKQLDAGSTNGCIDQIFLAIEDLIDARFISGAGGGGFLMAIMKKGVTRQMLQDRLEAIFQDSGVGVWECAFV